MLTYNYNVGLGLSQNRRREFEIEIWACTDYGDSPEYLTPDEARSLALDLLALAMRIEEKTI